MENTYTQQRNNLTKLVFAENAIALLKPSLAAYENCDIIDVNPGVGLWSAELHTALKPRSHLLLEPEDKLYHPFLDPLLKKRNSKYHYAPLDGYDFTTYHRIWHEDLLGVPQTSISDASPLNPSRDSLLLVANLSRYNSSLRKGVVHNPGFVIQQLINATWTRKMFQRYGLVRMLVWMQDEYKAHIIPRRVIYRKRQTLLLGSSADIQEVAGAGNPHSTQRDPAIDFLRSRTEKSGNLIPEASNPLQSEYISNPLSPESNHDTKAQNSMLNKPRDGRYTDWRAELASLEEDLRKGIFTQHKASTGPLKRQNTPQYAKLDQLRRKLKFVEQWQGKKVLLVDLVERSNKLERAVLEESLHEDEKAQLRQEVEHLQREVTEKMNELRQAELAELTSNIDDRQAIRQDPPLLHWDRRLFEPLTTEPEQFYPQYPLALLDFQFRSTPYMAKSQEDADYAELFEAFASALFINPGYPIKKALDTIAPGAGDAL